MSDPSPQRIGLLIALAGGVIVLLGLLVMTGALSWFGRLPGDLRWESGRTRLYVPLTSMVLLSVALTALAWLVRKLL